MAYKKSTKLLPYQYQPTRNVFRSAGASTNSCRTLVVSDSGCVDDLHEWEWGGVDIQSEGWPLDTKCNSLSRYTIMMFLEDWVE